MKAVYLAALFLAPSAFAWTGNGKIDWAIDNCAAPAGYEYRCKLLQTPLYLEPNGTVHFPFLHCDDAQAIPASAGSVGAALFGWARYTFVKVPHAAFAGPASFRLPVEQTHLKTVTTCVRTR